MPHGDAAPVAVEIACEAEPLPLTISALERWQNLLMRIRQQSIASIRAAKAVQQQQEQSVKQCDALLSELKDLLLTQ